MKKRTTTSNSIIKHDGGSLLMAMPQRDETIEEIKRLDALLEYAVMHDDEAEAARLRAELTKLVEKV